MWVVYFKKSTGDSGNNVSRIYLRKTYYYIPSFSKVTLKLFSMRYNGSVYKKINFFESKCKKIVLWVGEEK